MSVELIREMFDRMVVAKNHELIAHYYHPDFIMTSNGQQQDYAAFAASHERIYTTAISYAFRYDEQAWVQSDDRVAGRVWVTTKRPEEEATTMELILIATFLDGRIHRLWELTWPDWSALKAFDNYR